MRTDRRRVQDLVSLGLSPRQAVDVLAIASAPTGASAGQQQPGQLSLESLGTFFDASDQPEGGEVILWWNDIEKDKRYANWPKQLMDVRNIDSAAYSAARR
jgi:UDP-glucose:glycoprotein glucosyltransferase